MICKMRFAALTALIIVWLGTAAPSMAAEVLRPSDLNKSPEKYDGQVVVVKGILLAGLPGNNHLQAIYDSRLRRFWVSLKSKFGIKHYIGKNADKGCLTIDNRDYIWDNIDDPKYKHVIIRGEFINNYESAYDYIAGTCVIRTGIWIDEILEVR